MLCVSCHTLTSEALATLAGEAIELVNARPGILAGTRQTIVPVQVTVLPHPSRLTVTAITMDTGVQSIIQKMPHSSSSCRIVGLATSLQGVNTEFLLDIT